MSNYSQTWASDHVSITIIILRFNLELILLKWPLNNHHLSTTATIFGSQGWPLYTGLTGLTKSMLVPKISSILNFSTSINYLWPEVQKRKRRGWISTSGKFFGGERDLALWQMHQQRRGLYCRRPYERTGGLFLTDIIMSTGGPRYSRTFYLRICLFTSTKRVQNNNFPFFILNMKIK